MVPKEIIKINDTVWELPTSYKAGMIVPARIFATEELLNQMDDAVFNQLTNVACLPGIQKYAYCMADGHSGYGFPIGGVAAFDPEVGIISPGGIGYDINCLVPESKILTSLGYYKEIKDFEQDFIEVNINSAPFTLKSNLIKQSVVSFDTEQKLFSSKEILYFMKKKYFDLIIQIKTRLGYNLRVTGEHPILTKKGMVKAENLAINQEIAVYPFEGVEYQEILDNLTLVSEDNPNFSKQQKDELKKRELLPLTLKNKKLPLLVKLFGYLLGDGTIYFSGKKGFVNAFGQEEDLKEIQKDLNELGFSSKIYERERDHKITTKYDTNEFSTTNYELHCSSRSLARLFYSLGYPQGNKTNTSYLVPEWIMKSPAWMKRSFISALFGAELSKPRTHTKTGFDCPTFSMNKNTELLANGRQFCIQLMTLLEEFGIKTHKLLERDDFKNKFGKTSRLKLQISSEEDNLLKLYSNIGFSYNPKRERLANIAILYIKEKKLLTQKRKEISERIKELKQKGIKFSEVVALLEDSLKDQIINERFVRRHYYENAKQRITLDFISFNDFIAQKEVELREYGVMFDKIGEICKQKYDGEVYDFNIPKTHNFIANNIVVSNCGMRLINTNLTLKDVQPKIKELVDTLYKLVPAGVGGKSTLHLDKKQLAEVMTDGAGWCVENDLGWKQDLERMEENGCISGADPAKVSERAFSRGFSQLGTLGSGNHYLEIQVAHDENIFDTKIAKKLGITQKDQILVMVHCGSRGFGHQVGTDYLELFETAMRKYNIHVPDRELACAPFQSKEGQDYFKAMACAANLAFTNRQVIMHKIREGFSQVFKQSPENLGMELVYDVCHNIAKLEEYKIDGKKKTVLVHRKGATRALGPGRKELGTRFKETGQPVIIGGSMETGSYLLVGQDKSDDETFGSTCHGAGRTMSRAQAKRTWRGEKLQSDMEKRGIYVKAVSMPGLAEEAGDAYKNVDHVVDAMAKAGITKPVVALKPIGNVKG